jgi:hypothetical protein
MPIVLGAARFLRASRHWRVLDVTDSHFHPLSRRIDVYFGATYQDGIFVRQPER